MWSLYLCGYSLSFRFNTFELFLCWILGYHFSLTTVYLLYIYIRNPLYFRKIVWFKCWLCALAFDFWSFRSLCPQVSVLPALYITLLSLGILPSSIGSFSVAVSVLLVFFCKSIFCFFFSIFFNLLKYSCFTILC